MKSRLNDNLLDIMKNIDAISDTLTVAGSYVHIAIIRTNAI